MCLFGIVSRAAAQNPSPAATAPSVTAEDQAFLEETRTRLDKGDATGLADRLKEFIATHPGNPQLDSAVFFLGRARRVLGDSRGAIDAFAGLLRDYPASRARGPALYELGQLYWGQRDSAKALQAFEKASVLLTDPGDRGECLSRAAAILAKGGESWRAVDALMGGWDDATVASARPDLKTQIEAILQDAGEGDLERVAQSFPARFPGNAALNLLAERFKEASDIFDETAVLRRFIKAFPQDPVAPSARTRLSALEKKPIPPGVLALGIVAPISGSSSAYGKAITRGVRLALARGRSSGLPAFALVGVDTGEPAVNSAEEVADLVTRGKVVAVVGPLFSREVGWVGSIAKKYQVPFITASATGGNLAAGGGFLFRDTVTNEHAAKAVAEYATRRLGLKRFVVLHPNDAYGTVSAQAFEVAARTAEATILASNSFDRDESDFSELIRRIKSMDAKWGGAYLPKRDPVDTSPPRYKPGFDAIFIPATAQTAGLFASQLAFFDLGDLVLIGTGGWNDPDLLKIGGRYLENAIFVDGFFQGSQDRTVREFVKAYRDAYGEAPSIFAAQAYDAAGMILRAIDSGARTGASVRESLAQVKAFPGAAGRTTILPDGSADRSLFFVKIRGGQFVPLNEKDGAR